MTTTIAILSLLFATAIVAAIVGLLVWAITTQSRDDGLLRAPEAAQTTFAQSGQLDRCTRIDRPPAVRSAGRRVTGRHDHGLA
ncbi:MAG: hypothetical protein QOD66_3441 [Solirubrobacteraceae bacterium]|jgi:hypothetical protein|nr:hypothetical protein [Solirubrobacteraceae bacterium]